MLEQCASIYDLVSGVDMKPKELDCVVVMCSLLKVCAECANALRCNEGK